MRVAVGCAGTGGWGQGRLPRQAAPLTHEQQLLWADVSFVLRTAPCRAPGPRAELHRVGRVARPGVRQGTATNPGRDG